MNEDYRMRAICPVPIWLIGLLVFMAGCTHRTNHWQEDVQLSDGRVLTVDRFSRFKLRGQIGSPGEWLAVQDWLSFKDPTTGHEVEWQAPNRGAAFLDFINGRYWIVATSEACYPDLKGQRLVQAYLLDGSEWKRVGPEQAPPITRPNLVRWHGYQDSRHWNHISLETQREMLNAMAEEWKRPELLTLDVINSPRC